MNQHPIVLNESVFKWLDWVISTYGLQIYLVTVWLSPLLIAWILKGVFWRRPARLPRYVVKPPRLPKHAVTTPPPLPPMVNSSARRKSSNDEQSFAV